MPIFHKLLMAPFSMMTSHPEHDVFYIHRVMFVPEFYSEKNVFLCESTNLKNEFDTVFVNNSSGPIYDYLETKYHEVKTDVFYFASAIRAEGKTISETDCVPGPSYTKRAIDVKVKRQ